VEQHVCEAVTGNVMWEDTAQAISDTSSLMLSWKKELKMY